MNISNADKIKSWAYDLGFSGIGISKVERLDKEAKQLEEWLNQGKHGKMSYMANHFEKRVDPGKLVPGSRSVISLLYNYYTEESQVDQNAPKISKYAFGKDYHYIIKDKLKHLIGQIRTEIGEVDGRCFVDSAPVMERDWAKKSGLGWLGKNTLLIHPKKGSYFFLAELIIDLELDTDHPIKDHCGTCTKCIDACPTDAIAENGFVLDAQKCISYLTIELKENIPHDFKDKMEDWMFGCDICQEVCPWNRFSKPHQEEAFLPHEDLLKMTKTEWQEITREVFNEIFRKSAVKRAGYLGLKSNIKFLD
jgi:epoxyqueuosine reductase